MKTRSLIWALAALVLASCNDAANVEQLPPVNDHVLTASIADANPTRTVVEPGGTKVLWEPEENIYVFLGSTGYKFTSLNKEKASSASFEGTPSLSGVSESNPIRAISPYKSGTKVSGDNIVFTLPGNQNAVEGTYDPECHVLAAYSANTNVSFYNVTGGIRFTLTHEGVTGITLKGNDSEVIAGDIEVNLSPSEPKVDNVTSPSTSITLQAPLGGFKTGVWYYITTVPVKFAKGFTIDFTAGELKATFTTSQSVTVKRGTYGSISEIDKGLEYKDPTVHVESIALDKTTLNLAPGQTTALKATVLPENAADKSIKWSSSKPEVATVDDDGVVKALAPGTTVIIALTNDGFKTATCSVTVSPLASDFRTQYAESASGYQTVGNVLHFKYGTKHGQNANEFHVVPFGSSAVEDSDASHFNAKSSKTSNVSVAVSKVGNSCVFVVKALKNPSDGKESFSDLTFEYTPAVGSKITKNFRLIVVPSSVATAFSYKLRLWNQATGGVVDPNTPLNIILTEPNDTQYSNLSVAFDMSGNDPISVPATKDMGSWSFSSENDKIVKVTEASASVNYGEFPIAKLTYKSPGKAKVTASYTDYKGNKLNRTVDVNVRKNFLADDDYILSKGNSATDRYYHPIGSTRRYVLFNTNGTAYTADNITGITWKSSNPSVATVVSSTSYDVTVTPVASGDATITATGADGSQKSVYITVYKAITGITPNSTDYKLGLGSRHTLNFVKDEDFTIVPNDATYNKNSDFKWKSQNSNVVTAYSEGIIEGKGVGTTYVQASPKPYYSDYFNVRRIQVVDYRLKVTSSDSKIATMNTLYASNNLITVEVGSTVNVCYASTSGVSYTWNGTCTFSAKSSNASIVTANGVEQKQFAVIKGIRAGTAYIDLDYTGSNGRILQRYEVKVVPKFTWASGDIASNGTNPRPQTSPYYLAVGKTVRIYAYKGSGSSATQYSSSVAEAISWSSGNVNVATVSPLNGNSTVVTANSAGLTAITGTDSNGGTRQCWVQSYVPVSSINGTTVPFYIGCASSYSFTHQMQYGLNGDYLISPSNATYKSPSDLNWTSSNQSFATVNSSGVVTIKGNGSQGEFIIKATPSPNGNNVAETNVRTFKYVFWEAYCYNQKDGGLTQGSTFASVPPMTNRVTVKKGSMSYLYFRTQNGVISFRDANYSITSTKTNICKVNAYNTGTSNYVWISGSDVGTSDIQISIKDDNHYFVMNFEVTVTN